MFEISIKSANKENPLPVPEFNFHKTDIRAAWNYHVDDSFISSNVHSR
jgi:hypothetical protein